MPSGRYLEVAKKALEILPDSEGKNGLLALTDYLGRQTAGLVDAE